MSGTRPFDGIRRTRHGDPDVEAIKAEMQDTLDGRALRRLREALPDGRKASLLVAGPGGIMDVKAPAVAYQWDPDDPTRFTSYEGATIAEAADACREALEGR